jgi:AcrR family transcriptional regulator
MSEEKPQSRRDRNLADIRTRATDLAERIVLEKGGDALNARGLAKALDISVGSLYNAFGDLDGVVRAVNARSSDRLASKLREAVREAGEDRRSKVTAIGEAYFDFAVSERRSWWMLFERNVDMVPDDKAREMQEGLLRMLILAGGGDPSSPQHRQFFLLLWASVHGLVSLAVRPTIAAINPDVARGYIRELVNAAFRAFPIA